MDLQRQDFTVDFSFLRINIVREYFRFFFKDKIQEQNLDLENIIDDLVLLNFVVGNDFLPHLPGYNVKFAGVDMILEVYKKSLSQLGGYLTCKCNINLKQLE